VPPVAAMQIPPARSSPSRSEGDVRLEIALVWTEATDEHLRSYVNGIRRQTGNARGGLRFGHREAVRNYIETHDWRRRA